MWRNLLFNFFSVSLHNTCGHLSVTLVTGLGLLNFLNKFSKQVISEYCSKSKSLLFFFFLIFPRQVKKSMKIINSQKDLLTNEWGQKNNNPLFFDRIREKKHATRSLGEVSILSSSYSHSCCKFVFISFIITWCETVSNI